MNESSPALIPASLGEHTVEHLYATHGPDRPWVYWLVLLGVIGALASLPLLKVDVSVHAAGLVRPATARAELKPAVSGHIAEVLARDNQPVQPGQPLLVIRSRDLEERLAHNQSRQADHSGLIADLQMLTHEGTLRSGLKPTLRTTALQQEHAQFLAQSDSYRLAETKAAAELARYVILTDKGIATRQELDHARYETERLQTESKLFTEQSLARWQTRLTEERRSLATLISEAQRLHEELTHHTVRATADGVLVDFNGWSPGGFIAAGQLLGAISPEDTLQVEAYVSPRDIGLLQVGQATRLQIDAFPYTQWGMLDGTVVAISGDLVGTPGAAPDSAPAVFKVLVKPAATSLRLPNGTRGDLRKGLTLSARFLVAKRSLLQLLYDDASTWLDPQAGATTSP